MSSLCVTPESSPRSCRPGRLARARRQRGATLIEVLVSVVLLSFGIVGLAGLQMNGTKFNHSAYLRSQGTALAYDLADLVRANLCGINQNQVCAGYFTGQGDLFDGNAAQRCNQTLGDLATAPAMAVADTNQWKHCLEDALPEGRGIVTLLPAGDDYEDQCGGEHGAAAEELLIVEVNWNNGRLNVDANAPRDCVVVRTEVRPL